MTDTIPAPVNSALPVLENINLNKAQVDAIIKYGQEANLFEGQPVNEEEALKGAQGLVWHAMRARSNGNEMPAVAHLIALAGEIAFIAQVDQAADNVPAPPPDPGVAAAAPPADQSAGDYSTYSDEQIAQTLQALSPQAGVPAIKAEIDKLLAVQAGRSAGAQQPSQPQPAPQPPVAQLPQEVAPPAPAQPVAPQPPASPTQPTAPVDVQAPDGAAGGPLLGGAVGTPAAASPAADAPDPAAAQAQERAALEAQVTGAMLQAYQRTFADVPSFTVEQLKYLVANPAGPPAEQPVAQAPATPEEPTVPTLDPERERRIEQISGKTLKVHKKGRVDFATMSYEELDWIIAHPEGPLFPGPASGPAPSLQAAPAAPVAAPAPVPQQAAPAAPATPAPVVAPVVAPITPPVNAGVITELDGDVMFPDVADVPVVPPDISQLDDVALRSLHGRFHAVLARADWIIAQYKDSVFDHERDLVLLRADIKSKLPGTVEGKRVTKDNADAMVEADPRIAQLVSTISDAKKPLIKLEAIAENSRRTCSRCSREYSFRRGEELERGGQ